MPRQSRTDACLCLSERRQAPGTLHHVIIRGIERREIFLDDKDRESFLDRLSSVVRELGISPSAVSKSIGREQQALVNEAIEKYFLENQ